MVRNAELAALFEEMADHLELREESVFRIRAYRRAAQQLESLGEDAVVVLEAGRKIPGIGADLATKIREYVATGAIADLEAMRRSGPGPSSTASAPCPRWAPSSSAATRSARSGTGRGSRSTSGSSRPRPSAPPSSTSPARRRTTCASVRWPSGRS